MGTTKKQQNGVQPCHFSLYKWNIVFIKLLSISQWKHYPFFPPWNHMVIHRCRPLLTRKVKIVLMHLSPLHKYTFLITLNQLSVLSSFQQRWFSTTVWTGELKDNLQFGILSSAKSFSIIYTLEILLCPWLCYGKNDLEHQKFKQIPTFLHSYTYVLLAVGKLCPAYGQLPFSDKLNINFFFIWMLQPIKYFSLVSYQINLVDWHKVDHMTTHKQRNLACFTCSEVKAEHVNLSWKSSRTDPNQS